MYMHYVFIFMIIIFLLTFMVYKKVTLKSYRQCFLDFLNLQFFTVLFSLIVIYIVYLLEKDVDSLLDFSVLTAFVASFLINIISTMLTRVVKNKIEDSTKLTKNYSGLIKKYAGSKNQFIEVGNAFNLPVIVDYTWENFDSIIVEDNPQRKYSLSSSDSRTEVINDYKDELFLAHDTSNIYNQLNIRVDDWKIEEETKKLRIITSRTSYFASLMTNRVMDYVMKNGYSVRDVMQPGPFVPPLSQSSLSNHLGFNAFIITSDNYIPFIKRNSIVSIGKNTYGTSIGASLKTMYALESINDTLKTSGIYNSIYKELEDELKITNDVNNKGKKNLLYSDVSVNIIAAYRDIVEGDKPQLLVFIKVKASKDEITNNFINAMKEKYLKKKKLTKEEKEQEDGNSLLWFSKSNFENIEVKENCFVGDAINMKSGLNYEIVPSAGASILITQKYIKLVVI